MKIPEITDDDGVVLPTNASAYFVGIYGQPPADLITVAPPTPRNEPATPTTPSTPRSPSLLNITPNEMTEWFGETPEGCLKHIPADDYTIWRDVGLALKRLGIDYSVWDDWSATSSKYDGNTRDRWESFDISRKGYGLTHLQKLAREFSPIAFANHEKQTRQFLFRDLQVKHADIPYYERYEGEYFPNLEWDDETKTYLLDGGMGRGKSTQIKRLIPNYTSCLIITPRRSYATYTAADLAEFGFRNYLDDRSNITNDRVICSPESIHRVKLPRYDIVILDESETILTSITSKTMRENSSSRGLAQIQSYLRHAKKVVLADAFVSKRTLAVAESIAGTKRYIHLNSTKQTRVMNRLNSKKTKTAKELFKGLIKNKLQEGRNLYIVCLSKEVMLTDFVPLLEEMGLPFLAYHADNKSEMKESLQNVNESWSQVRCVMTTPTITIGINFKPNQPHFHHRLIYSNGFSAVARDVAQAIDRVRETLTPDDYIFMDEKQNNGNLRPLTFDAMKDWLTRRTQTAIAEGAEIHESSELIRDIHAFNNLEQSICQKEWARAMTHYLTQMGYALKTFSFATRQSLNDISPREWDALEEDPALYDVALSTLTEYQKLTIQKMNMRHLFQNKEETWFAETWKKTLNNGRHTTPLEFLTFERENREPERHSAEEVFYQMK